MESIGGYFSLELTQGGSYHSNAIALNTGRNCLEFILRCRGYRKVFIPYYTCEAVMEPFHKLGVSFVFYHIDKHLEIADNISLSEDEAVLYTNYFGLKQTYVERLARQYGSLSWTAHRLSMQILLPISTLSFHVANSSVCRMALIYIQMRKLTSR